MREYTRIDVPTSIVKIMVTLFMYGVGVIVLGLAVFPGALLVHGYWVYAQPFSLVVRVFGFSFVFVLAYFSFGFMLMLVVSLARILFRLNLREGQYHINSLGTFWWLFINAFFLAVKVAFMDLILLTPYCSLFYRLMGAKIGKNVQINSKNVTDLSLLEIGDNVVIGGNATIIAHSFEREGLILKKVRIGHNVIIGLNSVILPGAVIGNNAVIAAGAIVPKNMHVPPNTTFLGVHEISS